jgi:hypothetical protein
MPVLVVPGPAAPAPPPVTVEVPDAWEALPPGSDLLHVRGPGSAGDPVDVRLRPHTGPHGYAVADLLDDLGAAAEQGSEVEPSFVIEIGGREWTARNVSWDEPDGPVVEVHLATAVEDAAPDDKEQAPVAESADDGRPDAAFARLLLATGRVRGAGLDADYDVLQSVLESLAVGVSA